MKRRDEWSPGSLSFSFPFCSWTVGMAAASAWCSVAPRSGSRGVPAREETLQVAPLWQVSIDAFDFRLKPSVRWSIIRVHSGQSCGVMHWPPSPCLTTVNVRSELNYPPRPTLLLRPPLSSISAHSQTLLFYTPWRNTVFLFFFITLLHSSRSHLTNVVFSSSAVSLSWKCNMCQRGSLLLLSDQAQPPHTSMLLPHFPSCSDWKASRCLWRWPHSSCGL